MGVHVCLCTCVYAYACLLWLCCNAHIRTVYTCILILFACMHVCMCMYLYIRLYVCMHARIYAYTWIYRKHAYTYAHIYMYIKLIALHKADCDLAAKFSRRRENPVQPRLCNAKNAIFKRQKNGVFPSVAIFAGQLKRNQLYVYAHVYIRWYATERCIYAYTYIHTYMFLFHATYIHT